MKRGSGARGWARQSASGPGPAWVAALLVLVGTGCGYHVGGHSDLLPKDVKTIAVPAFGNNTVRPKLPRLLPADITRELISRTHYTVVADPNQADAVLSGTLLTFNSFPTLSDPVSGRATGVQVLATVQITLTDRRTNKVLFTRNNLEFRDRYEITLDPGSYFDESDTAAARLSRDIARTIVSAVLEYF
jgi:Lipopolysaccharide-assembly